jgi:FAD/FMN-containing dehydrogenase
MNTNQAEVIRDLIDLLGPTAVLHDSNDYGRYVHDWAGDTLGVPLAVVRPKDTAQVSSVVRYCHEHSIRMIAQGGHTGLVGGALPDNQWPELVISLERMTQIRHIDAENFTMTVDSGCVLEDVKNAALEMGCFFPLSLGAQGSCQIGGNIATNAGGVNVLRYGMMRQLVLGLEVVLPDGQIWDGMKGLYKDNRGYNLQQLFIGSEGTLGIVTGAVLKLSPCPEQTQTAMLAVPSVEAAVRLYSVARRSCSDLLSAFELIPRQCLELAFEASAQLTDPFTTVYPHYVLLELAAAKRVDLAAMLEGLVEQGIESGEILDGVLASSSTQSRQLWQIRESMVEGQLLRGEHLRTDVSVPISLMAECVKQSVAAISTVSEESIPIAYGHIGDGNLHINVLPPTGLTKDELSNLLQRLETEIFNVVARFNGSISAEHGIGRKKRAAFLATSSETELALLAGIKAVFDPKGLMGAGRILPLPDASTPKGPPAV